ncbi:MAG: hypothetical protein ACK439_01255 [Novosphingobium sp.]
MRLGDHKVTLALFAATVGLFLIMGQYFPQELAIPLPGSDIRPVLLLEFASQAQHLDHIFGAADDPARAGRIAGMNIGNAIDYLLMPAYGLMTYSFFRGIGRQVNGRVWLVFGAMGILAALADAIENALMFRMVADMASPLDEMALLPYPVWIKFGLLAVTCGGAALAFVRLRRWVLALLCLPAPLLLVPGMLDPFGLGPTSTMLIGLGWLAMGIHAATRLRPRLQANG